MNPKADAKKPDVNKKNKIIAQMAPNDGDEDGRHGKHCPPIGLWSVS